MKVQFEAGTNASGRGINYMICMEDKGLYAEIEVPEGASDDFGYFVLKQEIKALAAEKGIEDLEYWYDGQEDKLAPDADGIVRWYAVQRDPEDDWGTGSKSLTEAIKMARRQAEEYPETLVAVIEDGTCIDEIRDFSENAWNMLHAFYGNPDWHELNNLIRFESGVQEPYCETEADYLRARKDGFIKFDGKMTTIWED